MAALDSSHDQGSGPEGQGSTTANDLQAVRREISAKNLTCGKPVPSAKRRAAERLGRNAEIDVARAWQARGFEILGRRVRTGSAEIDLVVADQQTLVFIEVKARRSLLDAAYSIPAAQQARLLDGAGYALAANPGWQRPDTRFDVALVYPGGIETIEDAIRYH